MPYPDVIDKKIIYCERSELLICKMHQFGLGCIKNCARLPIRIPFRDFFVSFRGGQVRYFFDIIFGNSLFIPARRMFYSGVDVFGSSLNISQLTSPTLSYGSADK